VYNFVSESTPLFTKVSSITHHDLPFDASDITMTSTGQLVVVKYYGPRAVILDREGRVRVNLNIPGVGGLRAVARWGEVLLFSDLKHDTIHVIREDNTPITTITTGNVEIRGLDITDATLWLTTWRQGVYKLTINDQYKVINTTLFAPQTSTFKFPVSITVQGDRVTVVCLNSHNVHIFNKDGTRLFDPVDGPGPGEGRLYVPLDVVTDTEGRIYVADYSSRRIVLYSSSGSFIRNVVTQSDGMDGRPRSLYLYQDTLYVTTWDPIKLYVIHLT
jgi:hypothetical protein